MNVTDRWHAGPALSVSLTGVVSNVLLSGTPAPLCPLCAEPVSISSLPAPAPRVTCSGVSVPQRMSPNRDIEWFAALSDFTQTGISNGLLR